MLFRYQDQAGQKVGTPFARRQEGINRDNLVRLLIIQIYLANPTLFRVPPTIIQRIRKASRSYS